MDSSSNNNDDGDDDDEKYFKSFISWPVEALHILQVSLPKFCL